MSNKMRAAICLLMLSATCRLAVSEDSNQQALTGLPEMTQAADAAKSKLGQQIFFDKNLSLDGTISCATCHQPQLAFSDGKKLAEGIKGQIGTRNTPSLINAAFNQSQFWDGRRSTLESQAMDPFLNPREHGLQDQQAILAGLSKDPAYRMLIQQAYDIKSAAINIEQIASALASFERTLAAGNSPFDRYYFQQDKSSISPAAQRGLQLFMGSALCINCHKIEKTHALFTDNQFHGLGVGFKKIEARLPELTQRLVRAQEQKISLDQAVLSDEDIAELGRFAVTLKPADIAKFRTPSLRNVALTAPYMHDGSVASDGLKTYIWNARNQLIQIKDSTGTEVASFSYDALGRRQAKTINGVSTGFMYDGVNIVQELNGASPINNYISAGVDQVFVQQSGAGASATSLTYLTDALGSTIRLTNTAGEKVVDYSYDPYGNTKADAVINNSFQYTGRENDGNGLYYYRARYYSPATHRFISEDPIGLNGGINTYGYVEGDPISLVDPTGQVVEGTFDRKTATVTFRDLDTNATVIVKARAGNGIYTNDSRYEGLPNRGPLPAGDYLIANAGARKDHGIWYQLLSPDGKGNYDYRNCRNVKNPETGEMECRRFFNIHNDLRSDGCVTVPSTVGEDDSKFPYSEQFEALKNLLNKTKPLVKNGKTYRGWLHVRG